MSDEKYLDAELGATKARPTAATALLESIAESLSEAPSDKRYDIQVCIDEHTVE